MGLMFTGMAPLLANDTVVPNQQNDFDGDLIVNTVDIDDDNDGIPDEIEIAANGDDVDSDGDGRPDRLDLDSDNDGILDWQESGALIQLNLSDLRRVGPRLVGEAGNNGLIDAFESPVDSGVLNYALGNVDSGHDEVPDYLDLDSDNDGWPDLLEAGVLPDYDSDGDARVDITDATVGNDGVADYLQRVADVSCCDLDGDGDQDPSPLNTDMTDLPDFQDLDSDNDGVYDLVELQGTDTDNNGRVDNFLDLTGGADNGPDGMDDGLRNFPLQPQDADGNSVDDHIDFVAGNTVVQDDDTGAGINTGTGAGVDPVAGNPVAGNPVPDMPQTPEPGAADPGSDDGMLADESDSGIVRTGLNSSGCSVTGDTSDPLLLLLLGFSALYVLSSALRPARAQRYPVEHRTK